ncbi:MAG: class I SAM-dependent methyltransferase, partial [Vulcanimicrobiaceae bacterium]
MEHDCDRRHGAKQPEIFSHERAARLDDPQRETFLPTPVLIAALDAPHGANVLDFGAGTGRYAIALARTRPDLHVVAFDVQPEMTAIVRRRAAEAGLSNIETVETDVARLPRASFARILAVNVLHEIGDIDVRALGDLLGPGGYALLVDWDGGVPR